MKGTRFFALLLTIALLIGVFQGFALGEETPVIKVFYTKGGFEAPPENDAIKARIEQDSGVKFEFISPPSTNYTEQLHLMLSSGDYPDIVAFNSVTDPFKYWDEGVLLDISPYRDLMPAINALIPDTAMDYFNVDGAQIGIPKWTTTKRYNMIIRNDWLEKLGLQTPTTLEELHDVALAFTTQDPDGNGENDTYGISGLGLDSFDYIFGAFGTIMGEANWNAPDTHCNIYFKEVDGKLVPMATLPEMKEALTLLNQWYADGIIDPEFASHTGTIWQEKFEQSRFGITTHWWNWEAQRQAMMVETVPEVDCTRIAPPIGPTGLSGLRAVPEVVACVSVMANTKYPEECVKLMDYMHTDDGLMTAYTGVQDVHWEHTADDKFLTLPQFDVDNKWIQWYSLFENEQPLYKVETYLAPSRRGALLWNVIRDDADGITTESRLEYQADLQALCAETFCNMITGKTSLDDFDKFTQDFMDRGGQEWTDEVNAIYQAKHS